MSAPAEGWVLDGACWTGPGCPQWSDKRHLIWAHPVGVCTCGLTYLQIVDQGLVPAAPAPNSDHPPPGSPWPEATEGAPQRPAIAPGPPPTTAGMVDQGSARLNAGKPPLHLAPLDGLVLVSWVGAFGAEKYAPRGWEQAAAEGRFSWSDCVRALLSHTFKLMAGQRDDAESGLPHVGHIAWNALALCSMLVRGNGLDDLPGPARGAPVPLEPGEWAPGEAFHRAVAEVRARRAP